MFAALPTTTPFAWNDPAKSLLVLGANVKPEPALETATPEPPFVFDINKKC